ncbi:uncharacterized protein EV420DRAFT_1473961 [Desarmillaria tabescens]|uniref:Uncharacterized protein n=1 Tax=Armillaria tabescens TaxID=1929756 RepID=A0AA39TW77_ARMTA|nr:uncharacterized protein EV420DRAFT_1473961 [Desarmillaria tabescens]KAK0468253.1 hypothetical protein EV420DRAFT_1473961 [Desarmillaria tabescens]
MSIILIIELFRAQATDFLSSTDPHGNPAYDPNNLLGYIASNVLTGIAFSIGTRFGLHAHPDSKGIFIVGYLIIMLSLCAFIAADYVLPGRLSRYLGATEHMLVSSAGTKFMVMMNVKRLPELRY